MKTVGEILHEAREAQHLTLAEISFKTKITEIYLAAIEANDFKSLPAATFTKGFLRNYATTLGLDPSFILAIFRRDYDQDERGRIVMRGLTQPVKAPLAIITPTRVTILISSFIGIIIAIFFIRQIIVFTQAPNLDIYSPLENQSLASPISVSGKTHPEATVTINNEPITVKPDGTFSQNLDLTEGEHTLVITTSSRSGNSRTIQRLIIIKPVDKLP